MKWSNCICDALVESNSGLWCNQPTLDKPVIACIAGCDKPISMVLGLTWLFDKPIRLKMRHSCCDRYMRGKFVGNLVQDHLCSRIVAWKSGKSILEIYQLASCFKKSKQFFQEHQTNIQYGTYQNSSFNTWSGTEFIQVFQRIVFGLLRADGLKFESEFLSSEVEHAF